MSALLTVRDLGISFGGVTALHQVGFQVARGSITSIIGPNGAGKTTVFNCLTGFYAASSGEILLHREEGEGDVDLVQVMGGALCSRDYLNPWTLLRRIYDRITGGTHKVVRSGVARTFQNIRLFRDMTVLENLLVAQHRLVERNILAGILRTQEYRSAESAALDRAMGWLEVFAMQEDANRLAGELPYGQQRRLEIVRALCTDPTLLCLDEPAAGLNAMETQALSRMILRLRDHHELTVLLIEHDMNLVMNISDHVVVLNHGEVIAHGSPATIQDHPAVLEAYLGVAETTRMPSVAHAPAVSPSAQFSGQERRPPLIIDPEVADTEAFRP
ncbi:MAG: ATP-binding cassette domain-containing protein [Magnetococcales bacterium]|nr:ATP-binding cassette domain-containing protein [Magnetococcales bacterium]